MGEGRLLLRVFIEWASAEDFISGKGSGSVAFLPWGAGVQPPPPAEVSSWFVSGTVVSFFCPDPSSHPHPCPCISGRFQ